jgi:GxxExxY protein
MLEYDEITHQIIGCCFTIHNELGNGFQEVIYQRCLGIELKLSGLDYAREFEMPIYYRTHHVGTRRADFLMAGEIMVELKAVKTLDDIHLNHQGPGSLSRCGTRPPVPDGLPALW